MKNTLTLLSALLIIGCASPSKFDQKTIAEFLPEAETLALLTSLSSNAMLGRDSQHGGYEKAAAYASQYLEKNNIAPFYTSYRDSLVTDGLVSYNVVGRIGRFDPARKTVLIGAHLDHLGIKKAEKDSIYNGANDNASGVTAVLQIARFLAQHQWEQNILIALFADEEKGLKGAFHLAERFEKEAISIDYMVNIEMIGTTLSTGANQVYMTGFHRSNMAEKMNEISPNFVQFLPQAKEFNLFKRSDNYAFFDRLGIPAHTLASFDFTNYAYYHKAEDEANHLNVPNMNAIIVTAAYTLGKMLENDVSISLIQKAEQKSTAP